MIRPNASPSILIVAFECFPRTRLITQGGKWSNGEVCL